MDDPVVRPRCGRRALPIVRCALFLAGLANCVPAGAAERFIYRYLDDQGRAVYSEYPPPPGVPATRVDSKPAGSGKPSTTLSTRVDPNHNTSDSQPPSAAAKPRQKSASKPKETAKAKAPCEGDNDCTGQAVPAAGASK